jgi:hypothetical protein
LFSTASAPLTRRFLARFASLRVDARHQLLEDDMLLCYEALAIANSDGLDPNTALSPEELAEAASLLDGSAAIAAWHQPMDPRRQIRISPERPTPFLSKPHLRNRPPEHGPSKPGGALWTSSIVGNRVATWELSSQSIGGDRWLATGVPDQLRVWEIHDPSHYATLCERYSRHVGDSDHTWVVPNWPEVQNDWDAVHLSMAGLLSTQGVTTTTSAGPARLTGWDSESTCWLQGRIPEWTAWQATIA